MYRPALAKRLRAAPTPQKHQIGVAHSANHECATPMRADAKSDPLAHDRLPAKTPTPHPRTRAQAPARPADCRGARLRPCNNFASVIAACRARAAAPPGPTSQGMTWSRRPLARGPREVSHMHKSVTRNPRSPMWALAERHAIEATNDRRRTCRRIRHEATNAATGAPPAPRETSIKRRTPHGSKPLQRKDVQQARRRKAGAGTANARRTLLDRCAATPCCTSEVGIATLRPALKTDPQRPEGGNDGRFKGGKSGSASATRPNAEGHGSPLHS